jgi:hypothetical protein
LLALKRSRSAAPRFRDRGSLSRPGWQKLDGNPAAVGIAAAGNQLFQLHKDGSIWRSTGAGCSGSSCPGWQMLDDNPAATAIVSAGNQLFQLHKDGSIWRSTGARCSGSSCPGWQKLDSNAATIALASGGMQIALERSVGAWSLGGRSGVDRVAHGRRPRKSRPREVRSWT